MNPVKTRITAPRREIFDLARNQTSSLMDHVFQDLRVEKPSKAKVQFLLNPIKVLERSSSLIEDHIDKRIQLFFLQLICVHNTPYQYKIAETKAQGPSSKRLQKNFGNLKATVSFQSAHSATIPSLLAFNPKDPARTWVYLKGSYYDRSHNATIELVKYVNETDSFLDGLSVKKPKLRQYALFLLNQAAKNDVSIDQALVSFLEKAKEISVKKLQQKDIKCVRKFVLEHYLLRLERALELHREGKFIEELLHISVLPADKNALFSQIKKTQEIESKAQEAIDSFVSKIPIKQKRFKKSLELAVAKAVLEQAPVDLKPLYFTFFKLSFDQMDSFIQLSKQAPKLPRDQLSLLSHRVEALFRQIHSVTPNPAFSEVNKENLRNNQ